jgi:hypothetical protein
MSLPWEICFFYRGGGMRECPNNGSETEVSRSHSSEETFVRVKTKVSNLIKLGTAKSKAYMWGNSSKGACRVAHSPILCQTLDIEYWRKAGYAGFYNYYNWQTDGQPSLF